MNNIRKYGKAPYSIVVIHGGPGAGGEMAPVAKELSSEHGILEPIQTAGTIYAQVDELKAILDEHADLPITLVGYSWGAWLSYIFAGQHPALIKKLILISSGPFEERNATEIGPTRMSRLDEKDRKEAQSLLERLNDPSVNEKKSEFIRLGTLLSKADAFSPIEIESKEIDFQVDIFQNIWNTAAKWRRSGKLLRYGESIRCPVVAIHGDFDPHPAEGVEYPLSNVLLDFRFILLENCGHKPWIEREAKEEFYKILKAEL
jgi:pimeloyl-ACP methyl ester carboxylesterase